MSTRKWICILVAVSAALTASALGTSVPVAGLIGICTLVGAWVGTAAVLAALPQRRGRR